MDVAALQQKALASAALHSYHTAAQDYLGAMAASQEASGAPAFASASATALLRN